MFKIVLSCLVSISMAIACVPQITNNSQLQQGMYKANIAYIQNVDEYGQKIKDDIHDGNKYVLPVSDAIIKKENNSINVSLNLDGENLTVVGDLTGRSESGKTVFFETQKMDKYGVIEFSYISDTSITNMYFKKVKNENLSKTVLKLYFKDMNSPNLNLYFIEIFDVNLTFKQNELENLNVDPVMGMGLARILKPVKEDYGEELISTRALSSEKSWYCSMTYNYLWEDQTHTIRWRTTADYSDIIKGQESNQYYRATVYAKSTTYAINTDLNSNNSSALHIDEISLSQTSVPNTAWKSTLIDGIVNKDGISGGSLSASLGVSLGLLGVSYSLPNFFETLTNIEINDIYRGYENGVGGQYTRSIQTTMNKKFRISTIGQYFEVVSVLRDYGNTLKDSQILKARWNVVIIDALTLEKRTYECNHDVSISIV